MHAFHVHRAAPVGVVAVRAASVAPLDYVLVERADKRVLGRDGSAAAERGQAARTRSVVYIAAINADVAYAGACVPRD